MERADKERRGKEPKQTVTHTHTQPAPGRNEDLRKKIFLMC